MVLLVRNVWRRNQGGIFGLACPGLPRGVVSCDLEPSRPPLRGRPDTGAATMSYEPPRADFAIPVRVNLSSDTQTKPSPAMKAAMMEAEVGDEQAGSDPTVWALCDRTAALLGKEAAVFLPSGTMCNQVAIATHCRPGDEVLAHQDAHILSSEGGGPMAIAGVTIRGLTGARGMLDVDTLEEAIRQ